MIDNLKTGDLVTIRFNRFSIPVWSHSRSITHRKKIGQLQYGDIVFVLTIEKDSCWCVIHASDIGICLCDPFYLVQI